MDKSNADSTRAAISKHWNSVLSRPHPGKVRWWQSPTVWRYINGLIEGGNAADADGAFHRMIARRAGQRLSRGISVGCGAGHKEMKLLVSNTVQHFDAFELSEDRLKAGQKAAADLNLSDRITFHLTDAFTSNLGQYDLVYWNNSLHHMLDVEAAVEWSIARLKFGGWFAMDDFVGPSRFQWTDQALQYANAFRALLPPSYLQHPSKPDTLIPIERTRPTVEGMIAMDPSEAADTDRILPTIRARLPGASIIFTGGGIYQLALDDVLGNFDEDNDLPLLKAGLLADRILIGMGITHYAVAAWQKQKL